MSASSLSRLLARLGPEVEDPDEETFLLFAHKRPSAQSLGFIDAHAAVLDLTVAGRDLTIHQSPAVLTSNRSGGTTGAVLWRISPAVAEWLARPDNLLFSQAGSPPDAPPPLGPDSAILELGCGIAGVIGLALTAKGARASPATKKKSSRASTRRGVASSSSSSSSLPPLHTNTVGRYVLSDQSYVAKFLLKNLEANGASEHNSPADGKKKPAPNSNALYFRALDWETDEVTPQLLSSEAELNSGPRTGTAAPPSRNSFDAVLACDCIYNEALVAPLVQTLVDVCRLRDQDKERLRSSDGTLGDLAPTVCVVAQQLRDPDILTAWLTAFHAEFRVWQVPEELLSSELSPSMGFAVHISVLRESYLA